MNADSLTDTTTGALTGGVAATAGGIAAAVTFGYLASILFTPKTKS